VTDSLGTEKLRERIECTLAIIQASIGNKHGIMAFVINTHSPFRFGHLPVHRLRCAVWIDKHCRSGGGQRGTGIRFLQMRGRVCGEGAINGGSVRMVKTGVAFAVSRVVETLNAGSVRPVFHRMGQTIGLTTIVRQCRCNAVLLLSFGGSSVSVCGYPYGLSAPAKTTPTSGLTGRTGDVEEGRDVRPGISIDGSATYQGILSFFHIPGHQEVGNSIGNTEHE
jgi:hypothetical protein